MEGCAFSLPLALPAVVVSPKSYAKAINGFCDMTDGAIICQALRLVISTASTSTICINAKDAIFHAVWDVLETVQPQRAVTCQDWKPAIFLIAGPFGFDRTIMGEPTCSISPRSSGIWWFPIKHSSKSDAKQSKQHTNITWPPAYPYAECE